MARGHGGGREAGRKLYRTLACLAGLAIVLVLAAGLSRPWIARTVLRKLAASAGYELTIESIGSDSLSDFSFGGVRLAPSDRTDPLGLIAIDGLHFDYSTWGVLTGGLAGVHSIEGRGLDVRVDLTRTASTSHGKHSVLDVLTAIAKVLPPARIEGVELELRLSASEVLRAHGGELRATQDTLEYDTPIEAFGGRASAQLVLANGRAVAHVDARDMGWAGRRIDWWRGDVSVDRATLSARDLWIAHGSSIFEIPSLDIPLPIRNLCTLKTGARGAFRAEIDDLPQILGDALGRGDFEGFPPHRLTLAGRIQDGFVELGPGSLSIERGSLVLERGSAPLADTFRELIEDPALDVALSADFEDVAALGAVLGPLAGPQAWAGRVEGDLRVRGAAGGPVGSAEIFASDVSVRGRSIEWLAAQATIDAQRVSIARLDARIPGATVAARGAYWISDRRFENLEISARVSDLGPLAVEGLTAGRADIEVTADGVWPDVDGTLGIRADDVVWRGSEPGWVRIDAAAHAGAPFSVGVELDTNCDHLEVRGALALPDASGVWPARVDVLTCRSGASALVLVAPCEVSATRSTLEIAGLHLAGSAGDVRLDLRVAPGRGQVRARMSGLDPAPIRRFIAFAFACSHLDGEIEARWSEDALAAHVDARCLGLRLDPDAPPLDIDLTGDLADRLLSITRFEAHTWGEPILSVRGTIPFDLHGPELLPEGPLEAHGSLALSEASALTEALAERTGIRGGSLFADVELSGSTRAPRGRVVLGGEAITWAREITLGPWSLSGAIDFADQVEVQEIEIDLGGGARAVVNGTIGDLPGIMRALATGEEPAGSPLALDVKLGAADLAPFAEGSRTRLRRLGGELLGELTVRGTIDEPSITGRLHLTNGELRTATALPSIQGLAADLSFDGSIVKIEKFEGEMGGAPFRLSGSYVLSGTERGAHIQLTGENLLLYRQSGMTVRADAELSIEGPLDRLSIGGEVALNDSRFAREIDWLSLPASKGRRANVRGIELFSLTEPPLSEARFDIAVTTRSPLRISNRRVQGGLRPDLRLVGSGRLPVVIGTIHVEPTRVRLPTSTIVVRSGHIDFLPGDPFVPVIEIVADARLRGYDVSIVVSGAYDQPVVSLASAPPLAREDLLLLVLTGRAPGAKAASLADIDAARDVVVFLASDTMGSIFGGDDFDAESFADRFEIYTGQDVTQKGAPTMRASVLLRREVMRKNDALYLTGERDLYDRYNYGVRLVFRFP